jgi:hypothetical protein
MVNKKQFVMPPFNPSRGRPYVTYVGWQSLREMRHVADFFRGRNQICYLLALDDLEDFLLPSDHILVRCCHSIVFGDCSAD